MKKFLLSLLFLLALPLAAQTPVPPGETLLPAATEDAFTATGGAGNGDAIKLTTVTVAGPGFTRALHVETDRDLSPAWAVEVKTALTKAVKKGDTALLRFFARRINSTDETGAGQVRVVVQIGRAHV